MTKDQLQQELKEKVKPGLKPSHLRKLKKSKSVDDIATSAPTPSELENKLSVRNLELEVKNRELTEKEGTITLYSGQLQEKQKEVENLREKLETTNQELNSLKETHSNLLDTNLTLKHQSLKDWWQQYQKNKELDSELHENVEQAAQELISQDQTISQLRSQVSQLKQTNQSLQKDLNLATKLAELRKIPYSSSENQGTNWKYLLYSVAAVLLLTWLNTNWELKYYE